MAQCRFDTYKFIFLLMVTTAECHKCHILNSVETVLNSVVTLTCPLTQWLEDTQINWEVLQGERAERAGSVTNCSSSCTVEANNNRAKQPPCNVRAVQDLHKGTGSLIISPVAITDAVWYRCTVRNRTGSYCSEVKITVKDESQLQTRIQECKTKSPYEAVLNSTFKLHCPVDNLHLNTSQSIWGTVEANVAVPITRCPSPCTSSGAQKPICERAKTTVDGLLTISPVESTDSQWFWCALAADSRSCYKFKLTVKDYSSSNWATKGDSHITQNPQETTNGSSGTEGSSNAIVITLTSAISIFLFVALLVGVYICFRKKKKRAHTVELENPYAYYDETVHNNMSIYEYSLIQFEPASLYTFAK